MKAFIITLLESTHSNTLSSECVSAASRFNIDVSIWPAVNGLTDGQTKCEQYQITTLAHKQVKKWPGALGCFLSHFELWTKCVELNETIIILEHDGEFIRPLPSDIENNFVDVLNLDPFNQSAVDYNQQILSSLSSPVEYFYPAASGTDLAGEYIFGAYGYCIKPAAAAKLINFARTHGALPADVLIGRTVVNLMSTTVPVVRLHSYYTSDNITKESSTANLSKFI